MAPDDASSGVDDSGAEASATIEDVDHEHPETGETFDRTGVHARGKQHPDDQPDGTEHEPEAPDDT